jgi:hypothetical protein
MVNAAADHGHRYVAPGRDCPSVNPDIDCSSVLFPTRGFPLIPMFTVSRENLAATDVYAGYVLVNTSA